MGLELRRAVRDRDIDLRVEPREILLEIISLCYYYISTCQERPCRKRASGLTEQNIYVRSMRGGTIGRVVKTGIECFHKSQEKTEFLERPGQHCPMILKGGGRSPEKRPLGFN